jgi:gas vesicle protein
MKKPLDYVDSLLDLVRLERRRSFAEALLPGAALIVFGVAVGAGVGLMLAPSSGRRLRQDVGERLDQIKNRVAGEARRHGVVNATAPQASSQNS